MHPIKDDIVLTEVYQKLDGLGRQVEELQTFIRSYAPHVAVVPPKQILMPFEAEFEDAKDFGA